MSRSARPPQNLKNKVQKTNDSVGVSANTQHLQISLKSLQIGVPVDRPFRTFPVLLLYFLVSGAFLDPGAPQVGPKILPKTDLS